jgi:aminoglycoside 3-N-acetyltransferase I
MTPQPSAFTIRQLAANDIAPFRGLMAMFGDAFNDPQSYAGAPPSESYIQALLGGEHMIALVAMRGDVVIGGLAAYVLKKFERERSEVYIYDLAVAREHRRRGAASALIARLRIIAKARGASGIFVQADLGDEPAIALYAKMGAREDVLHFDIALD